MSRIQRVRRGFFRQPELALGCSLALALLFGAMDYLTGREVVISAIYLIPICWACWAAGRKAGLTVAIVSAGVWLAADLMGRYPYAHRATPYWNGFMLLLLFAVVVYLLSAFQKAHYRLEETVQERTAALQAETGERQRAQAARLQAERLAVVGAMAAEVAHEVRNPLGALALNLDLIHNEIDELSGSSQHSPQEARTLLQEMRSEVQRIQRVIEDYLQLARLPKPQRQLLDLNGWLGPKLAFVAGALDRDRVELRTAFDPALGRICADSEQLWQAILNLIRNGQEAMPRGGELEVRTRRDGNHALVIVTDHGRGMTDEELQNLFVPFYTTKPTGTGLGLAIVQRVVAEHGGHVECQSKSGQGSTFTVVLPLADRKL